MSKNLIIGLSALAGVMIIGGVIMVALGMNDSESSTNTSTTNQETPATTTKNETNETSEPSSQLASAKELLAGNKNRECDFSFEDNGISSEGTGYFKGGEIMRMDYTSTSAGKTTEGSMIVSKESQSFWDSKTKQGFKMSVENSDSSASNSSAGFDTSKKIDFSCKDWTVDEAMFEVPTDVKLTDFDSLNIPSQP